MGATRGSVHPGPGELAQENWRGVHMTLPPCASGGRHSVRHRIRIGPVKYQRPPAEYVEMRGQPGQWHNAQMRTTARAGAQCVDATALARGPVGREWRIYTRATPVILR